MPYTTELTAELNVLMQFNLKNEQDGIKIHNEAPEATIAAAKRLFDKGLISQDDGGYLTDLGRKAAEHTQDLNTIIK
ncbi:MAG: TIGR02647 family protein [Cocleimonas sp.]|nr:TIGR02647 family protein [Cocleimonas sp.]